MTRSSWKKTLENLGASHVEWIKLTEAASGEAYLKWLKKDQHADMNYMAKNAEARTQPHKAFTPFCSVFVVSFEYFPHPKGSGEVFANQRVAHYARGDDYHFWFRDKLKACAQSLQELFPKEQFQTFTDAVPLLERDLGQQAALGWVGKNCCLIHPQRGSLFFIGEILSTRECEQEKPKPLPDFCGSCTACMEACPTQALVSPRVLDANLCISYWTIESREIPPESLRPKLGDWLFGCDICQTVCPWNIKLHKHASQFENQSPMKSPEWLNELKEILSLSNKKLAAKIAHTPLNRARPKGLKRNALIIIGNRRLRELEDLVMGYLEHPELGELAHWSLNQLKAK